MKRLWGIVLLTSFLIALPAWAQRAPLGIAEYVRIEEEGVRGGHIVSLVDVNPKT